MTRTLRDYQAEAVAAIDAEWQNGITRTAIVHATGLGKSSVAGYVATREVERGGNPLILAHRGELCDQLTAACRAFDPRIPVGRVQAARDDTRRPITVAMTPTLASERRRDRLRPPTLIVYDECHHASAPTSVAVLSAFGAFDHVRTLGLTATLVRGDKRGLGDVWQSVADARDIGWACDNGHLVRPHGRVVALEHLDLAKAKVSRGDYQDGQLGEMISQDTDQIVKAWSEHARRPDGAMRRTVAFLPTVDAAMQLAAEYRTAGVMCGEVYGTTPPAERNRIYADLASGAISVLVGVMVTSEGWDCPPVECVLVARPTRLPGLYQQMVGRGLRPSPATGKGDCLVLDVVGVSRINKLCSLIDLMPGALVEHEPVQCEVCGGWRHARPEQAPCSCAPEEREAPDGPARLVGPASYEEIDLFATSTLSWLFTRRGVRFLPAGDRMVCLWPESNDPTIELQLYSVGHCATKGRMDGQWLAKGEAMPIDVARALAEQWAFRHDRTISSRDSAWRRVGKPGEAQLAMARRCGIPDPEKMRKGQLSDEISIVIGSMRLDR